MQRTLPSLWNIKSSVFHLYSAANAANVSRDVLHASAKDVRSQVQVLHFHGAVRRIVEAPVHLG